MCYKIKDFDEDRPAQYRFIREARSYGSDTKEDGDFFVPEKPCKMLLSVEKSCHQRYQSQKKSRKKRQIRVSNKATKEFQKK